MEDMDLGAESLDPDAQLSSTCGIIAELGTFGLEGLHYSHICCVPGSRVNGLPTSLE